MRPSHYLPLTPILNDISSAVTLHTAAIFYISQLSTKQPSISDPPLWNSDFRCDCQRWEIRFICLVYDYYPIMRYLFRVLFASILKISDSYILLYWDELDRAINIPYKFMTYLFWSEYRSMSEVI